MNKVLVDTNVLVYAYDLSEAGKQDQAVRVLDELVSQQKGVISTQVLSEFFNAVTRKIAHPLSLEEAQESVRNYVYSWEVLSVDDRIVLEAVEGVCRYHMSYWDSLIWATARAYELRVIFSEDFNTGTALEGVQFVNPFAGNFRLEDWLTTV